MAELESESFHESELRPVFWQFARCHAFADDFLEGEVVFLKSNPEHPMVVTEIDHWGNAVWCGEHSFPPQCLLQYLYRGLLRSRCGRFEISLN